MWDRRRSKSSDDVVARVAGGVLCGKVFLQSTMIDHFKIVISYVTFNNNDYDYMVY